MAIHPSQNSTLLKGSSKNSGWMASVTLDTAMALGVSYWLWEWTAISMSSPTASRTFANPRAIFFSCAEVTTGPRLSPGTACVGSILYAVNPSGCSRIIWAHSRQEAGLLMSFRKSPCEYIGTAFRCGPPISL